MACDPRQLANEARCIQQCIPPGAQLPALISLFCEIAEGGGGGGSGTVTSFSAGNLSPLFTTSVANPTTTPALTFSLTAQANNTVFAGPNGGGPLAPTFRALVLADISGLGTGVATALAVNVGTAGAFVVNGGALGTPSSGTLTSCTGLPISTGVSGLGAGVAAALAIATGTTSGLALIDNNVSFNQLIVAGFAVAASMTVTSSNCDVQSGVYVCQGSNGISGSFLPSLLADMTFVGGILTSTA